MITRRTFLRALALSIATAPLAAEAQQPTKVPRIGYLTGCLPFRYRGPHRGIPAGLREMGYIEGKKM